MSRKPAQRALVALIALGLLMSISALAHARWQEHSSQPSSAAPGGQTIAGELAKETREAAGEEEEENESLKHSALIKKLASVTGLTVHQAHLLAIGFNFAVIAFVIYWFARKSVPAILRGRTQSIQRALEDARAASDDANRRLAEIEAHLGRLDAEVSQMQLAADKESEGEEARTKAAAEDDIRKVVAAAEQEIAAAAKQARRELMAQTADLAIALARKQIQVDPATDQALVRNFAGKLSPGDGGKERA